MWAAPVIVLYYYYYCFRRVVKQKSQRYIKIKNIAIAEQTGSRIGKRKKVMNLRKKKILISLLSGRLLFPRVRHNSRLLSARPLHR